MFGVSGIERTVLGAAVIMMMVGAPGPIDFVRVMTTERRSECYPIGAPKAPRSCRWRYSRELLDIFKRMRMSLSARYGPGVAKPDPTEP
jgi:hypothetical protein